MEIHIRMRQVLMNCKRPIFMQSAFTSITTQQTQTVALSTVVILYYAILSISLDITFWEQRVSTCT